MSIYNSFFDLWAVLFPAEILENFSNLLNLITVFLVISIVCVVFIFPLLRIFKIILGGGK